MIDGITATALVSSMATIATILALVLVVRRQDTKPGLSRLDELEDMVRQLRKEVDDLKAVNTIIVGMNGDLVRKAERWEHDYSVIDNENRLLRQRLASVGLAEH